MPRARSITEEDWQTAAADSSNEGRGCFSGFFIPPLLVIIISAALASLAWKANPLPVTANSPQITASKISPIFTEEVQHWGDSISQWAAASGLNPNLAATVMQIESCGDPRALSSAGAMGLFQVMPFHFLVIDNPYNPETNATRGLAYLARSLTAANGDARLALAGYNGGIGVIDRGEWTWSDQTKRYVQYGWPIYFDAINNASSSDALQEWYAKYGAGMCKRAHERLGLP